MKFSEGINDYFLSLPSNIQESIVKSGKNFRSEKEMQLFIKGIGQK